MNEKVIDRLGRIVIPKVFRTEIGLTEGTPVIFRCDPEAGVLIMERNKEKCFLCHSENDLIKIKDSVYLCSGCLENLKKK